MTSRSSGERHRAATPLELFFDLCFVVAVAQAGSKLHHALAENHIGHGLLSYVTVFFAIWWAWMNFTWFASAYDTDDGVYRVTTLVQIAGALIVAAGVPRAFDATDFGVVTFGYVLMRFAMIFQWLRAAHGDPTHRPVALRYALGIFLVQIGWVFLLAVPERVFLLGFAFLVVCELAVPAWAERKNPTPWHPHHIAERYGLFTLIVLGESVLAATLAIQAALDSGQAGAGLFTLAGAGLVIVFSMWWIYFDRPAHALLTSLNTALRWGYGHYLVLASAAGVGAGLAVSVDYDAHKAHISGTVAGFATAVPVAVFLLSVWFLQVCPTMRGPIAAAMPVTAGLVLATPFTGAPVHVIAVLLAALVAVLVLDGRRGSRLAEPDSVSD
ncbi:low temperature requirement protein A [Longispora sp. NPDC051575]|uniref:low temperature requirement protein A n=1 Tax=Longispora sp. NPDC051575 TaxID=3154943 RepID=UPI0034399431